MNYADGFEQEQATHVAEKHASASKLAIAEPVGFTGPTAGAGQARWQDIGSVGTFAMGRRVRHTTAAEIRGHGRISVPGDAVFGLKLV